MKLIKNLALVSGLCSVLSLGACDATVGGTGDASGDTTADATTGGGTDATTGGDTTTATDTGTPGKKYMYVTIDGSPASEPDCKLTSSPGPDIDAIALFDKAGKLKGVAKPGTSVFKAGAKKLCEAENKKTDSTKVCGPVNGKVNEKAADTEYFGLSDGTIEVQIGACSAATDDLTKCDGAGAVVEIMAGDQIGVYEVDGSYLAKTVCEKADAAAVPDKKVCGGGPQTGLAYDGCKCIAEEYQVWIGTGTGKVEVDLGKHKGTNQYIDVKIQ